MKKIVAIILIGMVLGACTPKWYSKHCEEFANICIVDHKVQIDTVIVEVAIPIHDTLIIPLSQDTAIIEVPITVIKGLANSEKLTIINGLVGATAWVEDNILTAIAFIADSSLMHIRVDTFTVEKEIIIKGETMVVEVKPDWINKVLFGFALFFVFMIFALVLCYRKR